MKKVVVLLLLSVFMRDNAEAEGSVPSPLATADRNNGGLVDGDTPISSSAPFVSGDNKKADIPNSSVAGGDDEKSQWTASLLTSNPFIPFNAPKAPEEKKSTDDNDWASKKADELNLYSVTEYPTYIEVSIEILTTRKRCWLRSDQTNNQVPFVFVKYDKASKILSVKNTVTGETMDIRQQEKKKETSRSSGSSYYDDGGSYGSSYYDDDFLFSDFD